MRRILVFFVRNGGKSTLSFGVVGSSTFSMLLGGHYDRWYVLACKVVQAVVVVVGNENEKASQRQIWIFASFLVAFPFHLAISVQRKQGDTLVCGNVSSPLPLYVEGRLSVSTFWRDMIL